MKFWTQKRSFSLTAYFYVREKSQATSVEIDDHGKILSFIDGEVRLVSFSNKELEVYESSRGNFFIDVSLLWFGDDSVHEVADVSNI